jgi:predicted ester cyclase
VFHDPANHEYWHGPESVKRYAAMVRAAFPDLEYTVEDQIAEGNRVSTRHRASSTHEGELLGIAPAGNRVEIAGISIMRIEGGKIEEIWENYDAPARFSSWASFPPSVTTGSRFRPARERKEGRKA